MAKFAGRYDENLLSRRDDDIVKAVTSASVRVLETGTSTETTLYTDRTKSTTVTQPISPDANGNLEFFANPGTYDVEISIDGTIRSTNSVVVQPDGTEALNSIERIYHVDNYGAVGDGTTDDAAAIQSAIDASLSDGGGGIIEFAAKTYRINTGLLLKNTSGDHIAAPIFRGRGRDRTILEANFDSDAILEVDGSSHTTFKFFWFGGIKGLTFKQVAGKTSVEGLRHNGWWRAGFRDWLVIGLSDDGIYFPDRTADISANYDAWSSQGWVLERCELRENTGWGINSDGSNGWGGVTLLNCGIQTNDAGGAKVAGSYWTFSTCTIASNGGPTTGTSGIHVTKQLGNHPNSLTVERCELDGNFTYHLFIEGLIHGQVALNRMIHQEDNTWGDDTNRPTTAVKLGDSATSGSMTVKDVEFARNFHRTDTTFNTAVTLYDFAHATAGLFCRIVGGAYGNMTSALTKFTGYNAIADTDEPYIRDLGAVVNAVDEWAQDFAVEGDLTHSGTNVGFYGATPVPKAASTTDIKDALVALGLITDSGATPLNLDGGALTFGGGTFTGTLTGDNTYLLLHQASVTRALDIKVKADSVARLRINTDGKVEWGPGNNPVDTNLYREAASVLKTDDVFKTQVAATASRPSASTVGVGAQMYDSDLSKPIWSDGTDWRDASGTVV